MKFFKQIWSTISDQSWDADAAKVSGFFMVILGLTILVVCTIKWDFSTPAQVALALVGAGGGLLGWRAQTDKPVGN